MDGEEETQSYKHAPTCAHVRARTHKQTTGRHARALPLTFSLILIQAQEAIIHVARNTQVAKCRHLLSQTLFDAFCAALPSVVADIGQHTPQAHVCDPSRLSLRNDKVIFVPVWSMNTTLLS